MSIIPINVDSAATIADSARAAGSCRTTPSRDDGRATAGRHVDGTLGRGETGRRGRRHCRGRRHEKDDATRTPGCDGHGRTPAARATIPAASSVPDAAFPTVRSAVVSEISGSK